MATVWLDILTPKQFWFFREVGHQLTARGMRVFFTSRRYEQLEPFLEGFGMNKLAVVGEFGGASLRDKLSKSVERTAKLLEIIDGFDCAVSGGSPEAARIAYGLATPHVLSSDTPESPVNKLVAPLSTKTITPWIVGKKPWKKLGVQEDDLVVYRGLDPLAWITRFKPDEKALQPFEVEPHQYVLIRSPEYKASYLRNTDWSVENFAEAVKSLSQIIGGNRVVVLPRYSDETIRLKHMLEGYAVVPEKPVTDLSLLYFCNVFVGGGGTMTQEAALLGIPCISIYPSQPPRVIRYLMEQKMLRNVKRLDLFVKTVPKMLRNADALRDQLTRKAAKLMKNMENPALKVAQTVEKIVKAPAG